MAGSGGVGLPGGGGPKGPTPSGPPRAQGKTTIQVKAHTRAAPAPRPARGGGSKGRGPAPVNPLLNPNQTLSGKSLLQAAQALASSQTSGPLAELKSQIAANNAQTQGTMNTASQAYQSLLPSVQQGVTDSQNIASGLNAQLAGIGQDTQSQIAGSGQNALSSLLKYAPQGDAGVNTAAPAANDLTAQIARQQGLAAQQSGTTRAFGAQQGANYANAAASNLGSFGLQGLETIKGIGQSGTVKNQPLVSKIADLQAQQGALTATDLGKLRQQEVANQIARAGVGIKQGELANQAASIQNVANRNRITAQNDQANQRIAAAGLRLKAAGLTEKQQNDLANQALHSAQLSEKTGNDQATQAYRQAALNLKAATSGGKGGRALTPNEQNIMFRNLDEMGTLISAAQKQGETAATIKKALATGGMQKGFPAQNAVMIEAAYELLGWGHVLPQTANAMRSMGLRGGTWNGRPIQVGPAPSAKQIGGGGAPALGVHQTLGQILGG